jgi:hypothetical protein
MMRRRWSLDDARQGVSNGLSARIHLEERL